MTGDITDLSYESKFKVVRQSKKKNPPKQKKPLGMRDIKHR